MWYRTADRVLEEPEVAYHSTERGEDGKTFDHPIVTPDPNVSPPSASRGWGGDAYGKGFYTTQNKSVVPGYTKPNSVVRQQRLPRGLRLLMHDDIPLAEFQDSFQKVSQKYFEGELIHPEWARGDKSYTYREFAKAVSLAAQSWASRGGHTDKEHPGFAKFQADSNYSGSYQGQGMSHKTYDFNNLMHGIGYDGMQYRANANWNSSEVDDSRGDNILLWDHAAINHPREFVENRFRGVPYPEKVEADGPLPMVLAARWYQKHRNDLASLVQAQREGYKVTAENGKPLDLGSQKESVDYAVENAVRDGLMFSNIGIQGLMQLAASPTPTFTLKGVTVQVSAHILSNEIAAELKESPAELFEFLEHAQESGNKIGNADLTPWLGRLTRAAERTTINWLKPMSLDALAQVAGNGNTLPIRGKEVTLPPQAFLTGLRASFDRLSPTPKGGLFGGEEEEEDEQENVALAKETRKSLQPILDNNCLFGPGAGTPKAQAAAEQALDEWDAAQTVGTGKRDKFVEPLPGFPGVFMMNPKKVIAKLKAADAILGPPKIDRDPFDDPFWSQPAQPAPQTATAGGRWYSRRLA